MNAQRRKTIDGIITRLNKIKDEMNDIRLDIYSVKEEEEECFGNLPESMQDGEKAETMQDAMDALDSAYDAVMDDQCVDLEEAVSQLENAKGE